MLEQRQKFFLWATKALSAYGLENAELKFQGHSDNISFRVLDSTRGAYYLLRIHKPVTKNFGGLRQTPTAILSELEWLDALAEDPAFTVQRPVRTLKGALTTTIQNHRIQCSLLGWVDGEVLQFDVPEAVTEARQFGALAAALHRQTSVWQPPAGFIRPSYDLSHFAILTNQLYPGVRAGIISPENWTVIENAIQTALAEIGQIQETRENWGLIHADLHPGNCLIHEEHLRPIDFSSCGFGYYLYDIGTSLGSIHPRFREAWLDGYRQHRSLAQEAIRQIEAFLLLSRMGYYALILHEPTQKPWLKAHIPNVSVNICQRFLDRESFLFDVR